MSRQGNLCRRQQQGRALRNEYRICAAAITGSANVTAGSFGEAHRGRNRSAHIAMAARHQSLFFKREWIGTCRGRAKESSPIRRNEQRDRNVGAQSFGARTWSANAGYAGDRSFPSTHSETAAGAVSAPTATLTTTPDAAPGTVACGTQNLDNRFDRNVSVTAMPTAAGPRSVTLTVTVTFTLSGESVANSSLIVASQWKCDRIGAGIR